MIFNLVIAFHRKLIKYVCYLREFDPSGTPKNQHLLVQKKRGDKQTICFLKLFVKNLSFRDKNTVCHFFIIKVLIYSVFQTNKRNKNAPPFCSPMNDNALLIKFAGYRNRKRVINNYR